MLPLALLALVHHRGRALAETVRRGAGAGELAALQLLEVCLLHGIAFAGVVFAIIALMKK